MLRARIGLVMLAAGLGARAEASVAELAKLAPGGLASVDLVGDAVAIDGERAVAGAPGKNTAGGNDAGAVSVFERAASGAWALAAELTASGGTAGDDFGSAVALSGDRLIVGAPCDTPFGPDSGSAYVFERQPGGSWLQVAHLQAADGAAEQEFGRAVALDGDLAAVGAPVSGGASPQEAVYVFTRSAGGGWTQTAKLFSADWTPGDEFGEALALRGTRLLAGAEDSGSGAPGAAYVFQKVGAAWVQLQKLVASDVAQFDRFGSAVALDADRAVIGARGADIAGVAQAGAAYVFVRQASGVWIESAKLSAADPLPEDQLGRAVAIAGTRAAVGGRYRDDLGENSGAAYVFEAGAGGAYAQVAKLLASDGSAGAAFGASLGMSGDRLIAGALADSATVASGGAAYVFDLAPLGGAPASVSLALGGMVAFDLDAGHLHAGKLYVVLGSASGTVPGVPIAPGVLLPLNPDAYLTYTLANPGAPPLVGGVGMLGAGGAAAATLVLPAGLPGTLAGLTLQHAFLVYHPLTASWKFASNAVGTVLGV